MGTEAKHEVQHSVKLAKDAMAAAIRDRWESFIMNSYITLKIGSPKSSESRRLTSKVTATIDKIQKKASEYLRSKWHEQDCSSRAKSTFYQKLIEEEMGYTDSLRKFHRIPQCNALSSYHQTCDGDLVKTCKTVRVEKVAHDGAYKCTRNEKVELAYLEKIIFCPRVNDESGQGRGKRRRRKRKPQACVSLKSCKDSAGDGSMTKDCAMF